MHPDLLSIFLRSPEQGVTANLHLRRDQGKEPRLEPSPVRIEIEALVVSLEACLEIDRPDDEELRAPENLTGQTKPEMSQHLLRIGSDQSATAFFGQQVLRAVLDQKHAELIRQEPGKGASRRASTDNDHVETIRHERNLHSQHPSAARPGFKGDHPNIPVHEISQ